MSTIWVLVADSTVARIYAAPALTGPLEERETLTNPEGRLRDGEIASDAAGRSFDTAGEGRHAMEPEVSPKEAAAIRFATEVAGRLGRGRTQGDYEGLAIVAAPGFLGLLRDKLDSSTRALVRVEIDKNVVQHDPREVQELLRAHARPA